IIILYIVGILLNHAVTMAQESQWQALLDEDLTQWDVFMGVPHFTVNGLEGIPKGNGMEGVPLGLNKDPLKVFSTKIEQGETILHISGEIYGGLTSKEIFENYHLKLEFKWGERKWEPRLNDKRDNGLLYHCNGPHGAFWNVWMESQEFQIQEGDMGDYFGLAGGVNNINAFKNEEGFYVYGASSNEVKVGSGMPGKEYRCIRKDNYERPNGEWNTLELICFNGRSFHIVNGKIVMVLNKAERKTSEGFIAVSSGKLQLQSEAAEAFYRNILIREIDVLPDFLE
ncbi:MAG: DUF1080 domain-containing protein, partial [Maribacter sp.]|uniref:3-keto-disaccharide hydrolase n=1 Tax=Maribacter sp. TaxID=1897614 RepID=UPI003C794DE7